MGEAMEETVQQQDLRILVVEEEEHGVALAVPEVQALLLFE
jgi:hypothetical protein